LTNRKAYAKIAEELKDFNKIAKYFAILKSKARHIAEVFSNALPLKTEHVCLC